MPPKKQVAPAAQSKAAPKSATLAPTTPVVKLKKATPAAPAPSQIKQESHANRFTTTSSGLIQYDFGSDSDDAIDVPAPIPKNLQEDLTSLHEEQRKVVSKNDTTPTDFFTTLGNMGESQSHTDQFNTAGNRRAQTIQNTINAHANLIRKRALAAKSELQVVNRNTIQDSKNDSEFNDAFADIKKRMVKEYRMKKYDMDDYDSDDSDFAEDLLPIIDSDVETRINASAKVMAAEEIKKKKQDKSKLLGNKMLKKDEDESDSDDEDSILASLSAREIEGYRQAADALESSDSEVEGSDDDGERFGDSDGDDEEDPELQDQLNKDVFETQTSAFTTDENGVLVQVNHNISFADMFLSKPTLIALEKSGFTKPTPIQAAAVPVALKGFDIMANAVTGSGKTIAFLLPIIERLTRMPQRSRCIRAIIVTPTRELAEQIFKVAVGLTANSIAKISLSCIFGGVNMAGQETELRQSPDIVVCTPGRMIDHLTNTMGVAIDRCEVLVLDEADRLLDMGFRDEVQHIIDMSSKNRQTLLFSATINADVDELIKQSLRGYKRVLVDKASSIVTTLTQQFIRLRHDNETLRQAIVLSLCRREFKNKTIIFVKTKQHAQSLNILFKLCGLSSGELHGDLSQGQRSTVLDQFRKQQLNFLIATDIAARGLDIKGVMTVINMHLPINYNSYVHRVGRTARAGQKGIAISLVSEFDRQLLKQMMKVHDVGEDENPLNSKAKEEGLKKSAKKGEKQNNLLLNLKKREIAADLLTKYTKKIQALEPHVEKLMEEIKNTKNLDLAERDLVRAENLLKHEQAIQARPRREWFQTTGEKMEVKQSMKQVYDEANKDRMMIKGMSAELKAIEQDDRDAKKKKKSKKDELRGLSRTEKRRKLFKLEQEGYAAELRHELATNKDLTEKQRKDKHNQITSILKPQITAAYVKRSMRREQKEAVEKDRAKGEEHDGAGPQAFVKYAKQFDHVKTISNAKKRKFAETQLETKSAVVKNRRYADTDNAHDSNRKRFSESMAAYDKQQAGIASERKAAHKTKKSGFKSHSRFKRR